MSDDNVLDLQVRAPAVPVPVSRCTACTGGHHVGRGRRETATSYWTTVAALEAVDHRPAFGLNWEPSHFVWQDLDPVGFLWDFRDRTYHVDCKDTRRRTGNGRLRMLNQIGYAGPVSVEWEDAGMDRLQGAAEALAFVRGLTWDAPDAAFDAAFTARD